MKDLATKRSLRGRRIVDMNLNRFRDGRGGWAYNPTILLDDGTLLYFSVQETESNYGVVPLLAVPERPERVSTQNTQGENR